MAVKTVLVDDMDGGGAETTIAFVINGVSYSIDLSEQNAQKFYESIQPWIEAASQKQETKTRAVKTQLAAVNQRSAIRKWAQEQGLDISARGRIPQEITEKYQAAHRK